MERYKPTDEQRAGWASWVAEKPDGVRGVVADFPPWGLFRLKTTGQYVYVVAFDEIESVTPAPGIMVVRLQVAVTSEYNVCSRDRVVFGIVPGDLEAVTHPPNPMACGNPVMWRN